MYLVWAAHSVVRMKAVLFFKNSPCDNALLFEHCIVFFEITYYIEIEFI